MKSWKDSDAGRDWGQEEKGMTKDEMAGWHHWLDGRESEWTLRVGDGQGGLACCDSWGHKELDTTEWLNWTELRTWKQPRCPLTDEWIKKLWCIYTIENYSAIKKNTFESLWFWLVFLWWLVMLNILSCAHGQQYVFFWKITI